MQNTKDADQENMQIKTKVTAQSSHYNQSAPYLQEALLA